MKKPHKNNFKFNFNIGNLISLKIDCSHEFYLFLHPPINHSFLNTPTNRPNYVSIATNKEYFALVIDKYILNDYEVCHLLVNEEMIFISSKHREMEFLYPLLPDEQTTNPLHSQAPQC